MKTIRHSHILLATSLSFAMGGCKPNAGSQVQSLENFAANKDAEIVPNVCRGPHVNNNAFAEEVSGDPALVAVAKETLTAIPLYYREAFSKTMNGRILISNDIATDCKAATQNISEHIRLKSAQGLDLRSCFLPAKEGYGFDIVLPAQDRAIRHSLVRSYMSAVIFVLSSADYNAKLDLAMPKAQQSDEIKELSKNIALSLLQDFKVGIAKGEISQARAVEIFGESLLKSVNPAADWASHPRFTQAMKDVISYQATIETADQSLCSEDTKRIGEVRFANAMRTFREQFVQPIEQYTKAAVSNSSKGGFGLADQESSAAKPKSKKSAVANNETSFGLNFIFGGFFANRWQARQEGYGGFFPGAARNIDQYTGSGARTVVGQRLLARQEMRNAGYTGLANWSAFPVARMASLGGQSYECQNCQYG